MSDALPWAAVSVLLIAILALWGYTSTTRRDVEALRKDLEEFKLKVAEHYTTNTSLERACQTLVSAINELKGEMKEHREALHDVRFRLPRA
jgi:septal ring factor EnvC (AmiA/AmiB activator)